MTNTDLILRLRAGANDGGDLPTLLNDAELALVAADAQIAAAREALAPYEYDSYASAAAALRVLTDQPETERWTDPKPYVCWHGSRYAREYGCGAPGPRGYIYAPRRHQEYVNEEGHE